MGKMEDYLAFVKEHVGIQQKLAQKYEDSPYRKSQHLKSAKNFADLANFLAEIQSKGTRDTSYLNRGDSPRKRIALTYEDVDGAPEELLRELNLSDADKQDLLIEYLIAQAGGVLSLDKIMVEFWRSTRDVPKRTTLTSRLFRMAGKGIIYNVPGKKGVYSTYELREDEAKRMFGADGEAEDAAPSQPASTTGSSTGPSPTPDASSNPTGAVLRKRLLSTAATLPRESFSE
jgi:hypothetical protein